MLPQEPDGIPLPRTCCRLTGSRRPAAPTHPGPTPRPTKRTGVVLWLLFLVAAWPTVAAASPPAARPKSVGKQAVMLRPLANGAVSGRRMPVAKGPPRLLVLSDNASYREFWRRAHAAVPYCNTAVPHRPHFPPRPAVDFRHDVIVVVFGRYASDRIHVTRAETQPSGKVLLTVLNTAWPDVAVVADRVPYEADVLARKPNGHFTLRESPAAERIALTTADALAPFPVPEIRARDLTPRRTRAIWALFQKRGAEVLEALRRIVVSPTDPAAPFETLLRASVQWRLCHALEPAARDWKSLEARMPDSRAARMARARLGMLEHSKRDAAALRNLDVVRTHLVAEERTGQEDASQWLEIGQEYEYLATLGLRSIFLASTCYLEASYDRRDPEVARNGLLRAADLFSEYLNPRVGARLYWRCVVEYPDSPVVLPVLGKLGMLGWMAGRTHPYRRVCANWLARFPRSVNAERVRALLRRSPHLHR